MISQLTYLTYLGKKVDFTGPLHGRSYVILGFLGMEDEIVFVHHDGLVKKIPYDEEDWGDY